MTPEEEHDLLVRMDERWEFVQKKLEDHCAWKASASKDLEVLTQANLPNRTRALELKVAAAFAGLVVLAALIGWGWIKFGVV